MKNILIIFFIASVLNAQALELIYDGATPKWAIDLDGSTEYAYVNSPTGLDLNGSEMTTATADRDFSGAGNWDSLTVTGGVGTFTDTTTLPSSAYTDMVSGHNYTIQLDAKSGASSSFKVKVDNDSVTHTTTTSSVTKAFTFTYSGGSQDIQIIGVGTDTWTVDNFSVTEAYDLEIEGWFKTANTTSDMFLLSYGGEYSNSDGYSLRFYSNGLFYARINGDAGAYVGTPNVSAYRNDIWHSYNLSFNNLTKKVNLLFDVSVLLNNVTTTIKGKIIESKLNIGSSKSNSQLFNGQIGKITFTRKNGLGTTVSTSIYDWKGSSATFLNDKGTNGNNLTGVNVTTADQVKFKTGKYK